MISLLLEKRGINCNFVLNEGNDRDIYLYMDDIDFWMNVFVSCEFCFLFL